MASVNSFMAIFMLGYDYFTILGCHAVGLMESSEMCNYEMNMSEQAFPLSSDVLSCVCFNRLDNKLGGESLLLCC